MATTTPNYGWTVPTSTDLVKDGATAIETLGDAIDASMNTALGTKKAGMVLLNTTSFSGVSTQSVNSVFSATYTNYRLMFNFRVATGEAEARFRLRASGTDDTGGNYIFSLQGLGANGTAYNSNGVGTTYINLSRAGGNGLGLTVVDIANPFVAQRTTTVASASADGSTTLFKDNSAGLVTTTTLYDGFTIFPSASTLSGRVETYGYNA